ncbi:hypothetical protein ACTJI8_02460 [Microbacterium sp. 22303]|uniref:hypothetical protein n=1 Tax=Microbacterium sp. 22303 TaxID=3453905 RepID=UPI003F8719C5
MEADQETFDAVRVLVERTYDAMSTPGSDFASIFGHEDMTVAGSGLGELIDGPDRVIAVARRIASLELAWGVEGVRVWRRASGEPARLSGRLCQGARRTRPRTGPGLVKPQTSANVFQVPGTPGKHKTRM